MARRVNRNALRLTWYMSRYLLVFRFSNDADCLPGILSSSEWLSYITGVGNVTYNDKHVVLGPTSLVTPLWSQACYDA